MEAKQLDLSYTAVKAPFTERTSQRMVRAGNLVGSGDNAMLTSVLQDDPMCETADYSLRIWFDADTLKELGVTAQEAVTAIRDQNTQVAAGQIGAAPAPQGTSREYTINVNGRLADPEEFEQIFIKTSKVGRLVQVKDVGRGELGSEDYGVFSQLDGNPAATIAVYRIPKSNIMAVAEGMREKMAR